MSTNDRVTDEMVERALTAPLGNYSVSSFIPLKSPHNIRDLMRTALTAALASLPAPRGADGDDSDCCPVCRETERLTFTAVPEHRREYTDALTGEEFTDYMPAMRDFKCRNCDSQWIMPENQDDFR